jgi:ribosome-associated translation inhibitor RaiA
MRFSDQSYGLRIELDTKHFDCTPEQVYYLEDKLDLLRKVTEQFPVSDLYITIAFHGRSNQYRITTSLVLPGRTLVTGDVSEVMEAGYDRCVRKLVKRVEAYKAALGNEPEQAKEVEGTHQAVVPTHELDADAISAAVEAGDYNAFRHALAPYEDRLNDRIGRYVQQFPEIETRLGETYTIGDFVEEVYLNAFERFEHRPNEVRLGEWLEGLIAPSVKLVAENPAEELENISFARTVAGIE